MDLFNHKKVSELQTEIDFLKTKIKRQELKLNQIEEYLRLNGRKKTVNGQLTSCYEIFLNNHEGDMNGSI